MPREPVHRPSTHDVLMLRTLGVVHSKHPSAVREQFRPFETMLRKRPVKKASVVLRACTLLPRRWVEVVNRTTRARERRAFGLAVVGMCISEPLCPSTVETCRNWQRIGISDSVCDTDTAVVRGTLRIADCCPWYQTTSWTSSECPHHVGCVLSRTFHLSPSPPYCFTYPSRNNRNTCLSP